jgi:hypothetical protein
MTGSQPKLSTEALGDFVNMHTANIRSDENRGVVDGLVYYAIAGDGRLFWHQYPPPNGLPVTNIEFAEHVVPIHDARLFKNPLRLDVEGAALHRHSSLVQDFYDEEELRAVGYPEAAAIARTVSGARQVFVFDHNIRRGAEAIKPNHLSAQKPVFHVHTDFSADAAPLRAMQYAIASGVDVLRAALESGRRIAVLNVWRPIVGPVQDCPLALCEASSLKPGDLLAADLLYPDRKGALYYLRFNPSHRWVYWSRMQEDEVWVFKNYDSATDGRSRFTPHTAFIETPTPAVPRESVEFRTFAVFDP